LIDHFDVHWKSRVSKIHLYQKEIQLNA